MAKNRIIYQSEALYAGPAAAAGTYVSELPHLSQGPKNLARVQNVNYGFDLTRTDVNQFGELAAIDRVILESPTVSLDFSYYLSNFANEDLLGFHINGAAVAWGNLVSCISGMLERNTDERNYYIKVVKEGVDAVGYTDTGTTNNDVVAIGNAFVSSYSTEAAVGDFPTASLSVEALNIKFDVGTTGNLAPQVDPADGSAEDTLKYALPDTERHASTTADVKGLSTLKPGDITLDFYRVGWGNNLNSHMLGADLDQTGTVGIKIQNYNVSFDLTREPLSRLGTKFAFAREISFPVTVSLSVDALVGEFETGNLANLVNNDSDWDAVVNLDSGSTKHCAYVLKKAKLDSHAYSSTIGDNKSISLNFSAQIGSALQNDRGLFMSGKK